MLANGAKLRYKDTDSADWTELKGLKEIPEMGNDPEKVENTGLSDKNKQYENGIGDLGEMQYKFKYDNTKADSPYRVMRTAQDEGKTLKFQEELSDGTMTEYDAQVSVKRTGGGVNSVIEFLLTMAVQSDLKYTDPADGVTGTSAQAASK